MTISIDLFWVLGSVKKTIPGIVDSSSYGTVHETAIDMTNSTCEGINCFFSTSGTVPYIYFGTSSISAWIVFLFQLFTLFANTRMNTKRRVIITSMTFLNFSVLFRAIWFTLRACDIDTTFVHFINRLSVGFFFSGFTCYVQTWLNFLHRMNLSGFGRNSTGLPSSSSSLLPTLKSAWKFNIGLNVLIWIVLFSLSIAFYVGACPRCKVTGYILISIMLWLLSLGFLIFGSKMYLQLRGRGGSGSNRSDPHQRVISKRVQLIGRKVVVVMCTCSFMFLVRSIFWLWEPVSGTYSPAGTYPFLHYTVTGLLPNIVLFLVVAPPTTKSGRVIDTQQRSQEHGTGRKITKKRLAGTAEDGEVPAIATAGSLETREEEGTVGNTEMMNPLDAV